MVDRRSPASRYPLTADLAGVLAAARQRRAEDMGHLVTRGAGLAGPFARHCRTLVEAWLRRLEHRAGVAVGGMDRTDVLENRARGRQSD